MHVRFGPGATGKGPAYGGHLVSGLPVRRHGEGQIILRVFRDVRGDLAVIEVWDQGEGLPVVGPEDPEATSGRGLLLMSRPITEGGKIVWAKCAL